METKGKGLTYYYHIIGSKTVKRIVRTLYGIYLYISIYLKSLFYRLRGYKNVHFLHIRKTGGTALKNALKGVKITSKGYVIWLHPHRVSIKHIPKGDLIVFFIRDPISRFVSGFNSRRREGWPANYYPWTPGEREAFKYFKSPNDLAKALYAGDESLRRRAEKAMREIEHVNTFLSDWLISIDYISRRREDILFIGLMESLNDDFNVLKEVLGLPRDLELPKDPRLAHRSPADEDRHLDDDARRNLERWYRKDIELYEFLLGLREEILRNMKRSRTDNDDVM